MCRPRRRVTGILLAGAMGAVLALTGVRVLSDPGTTALGPFSPATSARPSSGTVQTPRKPPAEESGCVRVIDGLTPRERLAQLLMVGVDPASATSAVRAARDDGVGGIFVGGTATTLLMGGRLTAARKAAALPVVVGVDEEGGRVQRIDELDGAAPSARVMAGTMTVAEVRSLAGDRGAALRARGVTMDFAPVLDVTTQTDGEVIGDRSFGSDPAVVSGYAEAFAQGLLANGVLPVVKHFPGHGRASGDSHRSAVTTPPIDDLRKVDLVPYRKLLGSLRVAVMVGHMSVPGLTGDLPATLSPATYRLLRDELSFDGVAITDDLGGMQAVSGRFPLPQAVVAALTAGADIAFWSSGEQHLGEVLDLLENAVATHRLPQQRVREALVRVLNAKGVCFG